MHVYYVGDVMYMLYIPTCNYVYLIRTQLLSTSVVMLMSISHVFTLQELVLMKYHTITTTQIEKTEAILYHLLNGKLHTTSLFSGFQENNVWELTVVNRKVHVGQQSH